MLVLGLGYKVSKENSGNSLLCLSSAANAPLNLFTPPMRISLDLFSMIFKYYRYPNRTDNVADIFRKNS
jgi:hypothetical protein